MPTRAPSSRTTSLGAAALVLAGAVAVACGAYAVGSGPDAAQPPRVVAPVAAAAPSVRAPSVSAGSAVPSGVLVGDTVSTGLRPVTKDLAAVVAGRQSWVRIPWTTDAPVCSVAVTVTSAGAAVGYPVNTNAFSSFYKQDSLAAAGRDYTAVRLLVPAMSSASSVTADVTASYTTTAGTVGVTAPRVCTGTSVTRTYRVTLPVEPATTAG